MGAGCNRQREATPVEEDVAIPQVPTPPADGARLVATRHGLAVLDRPSVKGQPVGLLRAGALVPRSATPYSTRGCAGGWYPVRPRGFVCAGDGAALELDAPVARVLGDAAPAPDRAMPYRYGRVAKGAGVVYYVLPTPEQQHAAEPRVGKEKPPPPSDAGTGANDVPLDEAGMPQGPAVLRRDGEGVAADGRRTTESFFVFAGSQAPPSPLTVGTGLVAPPESASAAPAASRDGEPVASKLAPADGAPQTEGERDGDASLLPSAPPHDMLRRRSGVALVGTFLVGDGERARRFGLMPDGRFVAIDRLAPALGTSWHGVPLGEGGLPVAFAMRGGARYWSFDKSGAPKAFDDELERGEALLLSGRFRSTHGLRYFHTRDDRWVRHREIVVLPKRHRFPEWATGEQKWLDISLVNQTAVAWHGRQAVYATLISSGRDRLGDPQAGPATPQGVFRVRAKHITRTLDEREVGSAYSLLEAPWVLELDGGFNLVGAYWQHQFGEPYGHHDIALAPVDARWLFHFAEPAVPDGWHTVTLDEREKAASLIVYVHR